MASMSRKGYRYLLATLPPLISILSPHLIAHPLLRHSTVLFYALFLIPLLECLIGSPHPFLNPHRNNPLPVPKPPTAPTTFHNLPIFRLSLFATVTSALLSVLHILLCIGLSSFPHSTRLSLFFSRAAPRTPLETLLSILSHGYAVLPGYAAAHELLHKAGRDSRLERLFSWLFLSFLLNPAYLVDHHHHHQHVATAHDTASALRGESAYAFALRMEAGAWTRALRASISLLRLRGCAALLRDRFAAGVLLGGGALAAARITLGAAAAAVYLAVAALGLFLMDCANYTQHYGLRRKTLPRTGAPEPVARWHSWDCPNTLSNALMFDVGAHAHHHIEGQIVYPALVHGVGPEYPIGIHCVTWLAVCPPLFWRMAHPIIDEIERRREQCGKAQ